MYFDLKTVYYLKCGNVMDAERQQPLFISPNFETVYGMRKHFFLFLANFLIVPEALCYSRLYGT